MTSSVETAQDAVLKSKSASSLKVEKVDGVVDYVHFDEADKTFTHEIVQDVEPILNYTKALANENNAGKSQSGDLRYVGSFPIVIAQAWLNVRGLTMADLKGSVLDDFVNDPNNSAFRIWKGRV